MNMKIRAMAANIMLKTTDEPAVLETTVVVLAVTVLVSRATANSVVCVHEQTKYVDSSDFKVHPSVFQIR